MAPSPVMSFPYTTKPACHGTFFLPFLWYWIVFILHCFLLPAPTPPPPFSTFLVHHHFVLFVHDDFRGHLGGLGPLLLPAAVFRLWLL